MKKLSIAMLLLTMTSCLLAQDKKDKKVMMPRFYAMGGVTFPSISNGDESWEGGLVGAQFGLGFSIDPGVPNMITYQAELNFSMQGGKYDEGPPVGEGKVLMNYINLPIVIQHRTAKGFYGEVGIQPGFLVSAKDKYGGQTADFKDYVNGFDLGIPVGIGYVILNTVAINLRYTHGVSNIYKDDTDTDHNTVFAFRVLWLIH